MGQITHELVLEVLDGCGASALQEAGRAAVPGTTTDERGLHRPYSSCPSAA